MKKQFLWIVLIIILCLPAVWALFQPGFFSSHDGEWMVIRLTDFHRSLRDGQFPVRFAGRLNHGYGYPVFNFLYPFSFYLTEFFHLLGFSFVNSIKVVFILSFLLSGIFMFLWTKNHWGKLGGLISALVYVYTPYRFLDVYVRGSLGEAVAFIFPPIIFLSIDRLRKKRHKIDLIIGALALAALITSHNTMAMFFTGLTVAYIFFLKEKKSIIYYLPRRVKAGLLSTIFFGLLLSCFFWLPALLEKKHVIFGQVLISNFFVHFPTLRQLLVPSWGYGPSLPLSDQDTLSFQIGTFNLLVFILVSVLMLIKSKFRKKKEIKFFFLIFLVSFFLMTKHSYFFWRVLLVYNFIQFPWRLLSLTTFSTAFLAGALIKFWPQKFKKITAFFFIVFLLILNRSYIKPEYHVVKDESFYTTNEATTTVANEYMPVWVKDHPQKRAENKIEILKGKGKIEDLVVKSNKISFLVRLEEESLIQINTIYYPGWQVFVDNQDWDFDFENKYGLIQFSLPKDSHEIVVIFKETVLRKTANIISLISLVFLFGVAVKEYVQKKKKK
ncbi:hypothetical protein ISS85_03085 [Candidatus Microgenomates bacterium]|nr:hypothetical protein [Candidatus Microgenomates bacterium]